MPLIPRQVKPPTRLAITCKLPEETATTLKHYAEFLESTQEYVVGETLRLAFRRDKEFQAWLATTYPEAPITPHSSQVRSAEQERKTHAPGSSAVLADSRRERSVS